ncbi:MAG: Holliday junction resolvase RuvX [Fimbriimonadaceae bacterium]|nr:Holliday junction resolvase RuvX [Fimbriimonadaceae bacterium]
MRVMAVDFGGAKIGLAVGDTETRVASPRPNLSASGTLATDAAALVARARAEEAEAMVVGIPLDAGGETKMSRVCRRLGDLVAAHGLPVAFVDESLTSHAAETDMLAAGLKGSQRRKLVDGEAACRIMERFLESHGRTL